MLKYVLIKRNVCLSNSMKVVIQIIDISAQVRLMQSQFKSTNEKMLQAQMNIIVSHEMRNPINSIHCQYLM